MNEINEIARYCFNLLADYGDKMDVWFNKNSDGLLFILIVVDIVGVIAMWIMKYNGNDEVTF